MAVSTDSLIIFLEAATLGSFSAAARKLGKRQSTISEAIANLEIELGVTLFDRTHRLPNLTPIGAELLGDAQKVLNAREVFLRKASLLSEGAQLKITLAISDLYPSNGFRKLLKSIDQKAPSIRLECLIAEDDDIVTTVQKGRAHIGLLATSSFYPADIKYFTLNDPSEMILVAASDHPLSSLKHVKPENLREYRELKIEPFEQTEHKSETSFTNQETANSQPWSTSHYMVLLEMVILGYGWAQVPKWLISDFTPGRIRELPIAGWPKKVPIDAIWSTQHEIEPITAWVLNLLQKEV